MGAVRTGLELRTY